MLVVQWIGRKSPTLEIAGSNPAEHTNIKNFSGSKNLGAALRLSFNLRDIFISFTFDYVMNRHGMNFIFFSETVTTELTATLDVKS